MDFLRAADQGTTWLLSTRTDRDGAFLMDDVTEGLYQIEVDHPAYPLVTRDDVQAVAEQTLPRDSALAIIQTAFGLDLEEAEELLGSAGTDEFETPQKAPAPPGAFGNAPPKVTKVEPVRETRAVTPYLSGGGSTGPLNSGKRSA